MALQPQVNEHFFDEESKAMWYVLGISFARYAPASDGVRNTWTSKDENLLKIVKRCLEAKANLGKPGRTGSRNFQFRSWYLHDRLVELGCVPDRQARRFPEDISDEYLDHFVRGIFDAKVNCYNGSSSPYVSHYVDICFNVPFLKGMHDALIEHADVKALNKPIKRPVLRLKDCDVTSVFEFMYRDWEYIKASRLYLPEKRDKFTK